MTTLEDVLSDVSTRLAAAGIPSPRAEARLLIGHVLGWSTAQVFARTDHVISEKDGARVVDLLSRRTAGEPMAHIMGEREFWGLPFFVTPATLIPRPDTETLVDLSLKLFASAQPDRILDLGTGSGCLLIALLSEFRNATGVGADISTDALKTARENAQRNDVESRATFAQSDWTQDLMGTFDLVISNPPYIRRDEIDGLDADVRDYEPHAALDGGKDGLDSYRVIFRDAARLLSDNGFCIVEFGVGQEEGVRELAEVEEWFFVEARRDLAGYVRCMAFSKKRLESKQATATF